MAIDIARIKRVIEGAQARDQGRFAAEIGSRLPADTPPDTRERIIEMMRFYIETTPDMLEVAEKWTIQNGIERYYQPLFAQLEAYFFNPDDEIEDERYGLYGVLDDAYLALKTVQMIQEAGMPLLSEAHLPELNAQAQQIMGVDIAERLDARLHEANADILEMLIRSSDEILSVVASSAATPPITSMDAQLFGSWQQVDGDAHWRFESNGRLSHADGQPAGRWQADGIILSLIWLNHTYTDYFYEVDGERLTLKQPGRSATFWEKTAD